MSSTFKITTNTTLWEFLRYADIPEEYREFLLDKLNMVEEFYEEKLERLRSENTRN